MTSILESDQLTNLLTVVEEATRSNKEGVPLDSVFATLRDFCVDDANTNCFLIDKDAKGPVVEAIHELVDLKLLHLVRSRVTVSGKKGRVFEAYMLDLSQYAGARTKRGLELIEFWKESSAEQLRRATLIFDTASAKPVKAEPV